MKKILQLISLTVLILWCGSASAQLTLTVSKTNATSGCNGTSTASAIGGHEPYTYSWSNGWTTAYVDSLCAGAYTVIVSDSSNISDTASVTIINDTSSLMVSVAKTNATSGCNGNANASVTGGLAPYVYSWSNGRNTAYIDSLCANTYNLVVTDVNGDSAIASVTIINDTTSAIVVSVSKTNATGGCNGTATASVTGGLAPYVYSWSNGGNTIYIDSLCANTYNLLVTDVNGDSAFASVTIINDTTSAIVVSVSKTNATGGCNGTATASTTGGLAPYVYSWSNGGNTTYVDSLCANTYNLLVTDVNGDSAFASVTIINDTTSALLVSVSKTNTTGGCIGTATASATGGLAPYVYSWSNGGNTTYVDSLCAGTYNLTVTDVNGDTAIASVTITNDTTSALSVTVSITNATSGCNGNATAAATGGSAPYAYLWSTGGNTPYKDSLCAGTYTITITDINGLTATASCTITNDTTIALVVSVTKTDATSGCNGTATATATGGLAPYVYSWSNGGNTTYIDSLCAGTYNLIVTDVNGDSAATSFTITSSPLVATVTATQTTGGVCNGTATVSAAGGSAPYVYSWSTGGSGTYKDSLCLGTFYVIVTDINGLTDTASFTITADSTYNPCTSFTASISSTLNQTFPGACDGTAISAVTNGVAPYLFNWGTGLSSTTPQFSGLCAGSFILTVTDANGCSTTATGSVGTDSVVGPCNGVVINVALTTTSASAGLCDGAAFSTVAGGTAPYLFTWSNGYHTSSLTNACPGYYNVQVKDAIGCLGASSIFVQGDTTVPIPLMISISTNDVDSAGACNGTAHVNAAGGVGPYSIIYSNGFSGGQVSNLCGGYYAAYVTDVNGLSDSIAFVIGSPENTFINDTASDPLNDSVVVATLTSEAILSCGIDFTTIDSIAVTDYYLGNNDSVVVVWTLYSIINGDTTLPQLYGAGQDGVYEVVLSLFCDGRSAAGFAKAYSKILVNDQLTGINTHNEAKTKTVVYPNPFIDSFNINLKETAKVIVTDIAGKTIIVRQANSGSLQIQANNLAKGIYFVIIENKKGREVTKLVRE